MANWVTIEETTYTASGKYGTPKITLQYDADRDTATERVLRFTSSISGTDAYCVYWNPSEDGDHENVFVVKENGKSSVTSDEFKIYKDYKDTKFTIPTYWFCHTGYMSPFKKDGRWCLTYENSSGKIETRTVYQWFRNDVNWFDNSRRGFVTKVSGYDTTALVIATDGKSPTLYIKDNGNNTIKLYGALGKAGENNDIVSATLYYTIDGSDPKDSVTRESFSSSNKDNAGNLTTSFKSAAEYSQSITLTKSGIIRAYIECEFEYNTTSASSDEKYPNGVTAKYYEAPNNPGVPYLVESSFKNKRLTVKQDWGWEWEVAKPYNTQTYNKVIGYLISLIVNNESKPIVEYKNPSKILSKELGQDDYGYFRDATKGLPMDMRPTDQNIKPGDKVKLAIQAYSMRGDGVYLYSTPAVLSDEYTVENAGVVRIKVDGEWVEGQVWVKADNKWHEAEMVNVKVNGTWKESQ